VVQLGGVKKDKMEIRVITDDEPFRKTPVLKIDILKSQGNDTPNLFLRRTHEVFAANGICIQVFVHVQRGLGLAMHRW
jgi:hypothetical protein